MGGAGGTAALPARAETGTFTPVTTEEAFRERVVGREVVYDNGAIGTYGADNTWTVTGAGGEVLASGTWVWRDDRWCYGGRVGGAPLAPRCDSVAASDAGVRFTQEDGTVGTLLFRT